MKIFRKTFITVFSCFLIIIIILSYILANNHINDSEKSLIEQNRIYGKIISKQIEIGYLQSDWPYELLNELSNRDDFIFWWVVKDDGTIYRSDNISFMKTNAFEYFPQLNDRTEFDDIIYSNEENNYAIYFKSFDYGNEIWTIWIGFSLDIVYATSMNIVSTVFIVVITTLLAIFFILFFLVRSFTNPIIRLWNGVSEFGKGNFDASLDVQSKDEIGQLSSEFNIMTKNIKDAKLEIEQYSENLERLLKQKDEFIHQLSHDLKSPLTPLINLIPILQKKNKDEECNKILEILMRNTNHMKNLVTKTLILAKLNSPTTTFTFTPSNINEEINHVLERNMCLIEAHNITILKNIDENIMIEIDKLQFSELMDNLLSNAIKYGPNGGDIIINGTIEKDHVIISIVDSGIGMTEDQIDHAFDEFYKTDPSRHDLDSSGLGLSICKRIVELHGGNVGVKSQGLGKGSTFYFSLPFNSQKENSEIPYDSDKDVHTNIDRLIENINKR